jgi:hypothetical protein
LGIRQKALGPEHPDLATSLNNLAVLYVDMGNFAAAKQLLRGFGDILYGQWTRMGALVEHQILTRLVV